jgi:hypothetical protein
MDMGFSRRGAGGQQRQQAEQLAILLSEIAARQAATPTARVQMLLRKTVSRNDKRDAVSAFAPAMSFEARRTSTCAFHERVANSVGTENQER